MKIINDINTSIVDGVKNVCVSGEIFVEELCSSYATTINETVMLMVFLNIAFFVIYPFFERNLFLKWLGEKTVKVIYSLMETFLIGFNVYIGYVFLITNNFDFVFGFKKYVWFLFIFVIIGIIVKLLYKYKDKIKGLLEKTEDEDTEDK